MTVKHSQVIICDRCAGTVEDKHWETRIGKLQWKRYKKTIIGRLSWMKKRNGGGSQDSWMSLDLCFSCTEGFLAFMKGK
jgi:hypothetical protein